MPAWWEHPSKEDLPSEVPIGYIVIIDMVTMMWWGTKFVYSPDDANDWLDYLTGSDPANLPVAIPMRKGCWN